MSEPAVVPHCYRRQYCSIDDPDDVPLYPSTMVNAGGRPVRSWTLVRDAFCGGMKWTSTTGKANTTITTDQETPTSVATQKFPLTDFGPSPTSALPYTDEQYEQLLTSSEWTREETDYLFSLCARYYHRLIVVAGHYTFMGGATIRNLEDIRERYYQVMNQLYAVNSAGKNFSHTYSPHHYDKEGDKHRRLVLSSFLSRPQEVQTEEALLAEAMGAMRLALPRVLQERERLLLCCGGLGQHLLAHAPTLPELCGGGTGNLMGTGGEKKNKRPPSASSAAAAAVTGTSSEDGKKKRKKQSTSRSSPGRTRSMASVTPTATAVDSDVVYNERPGGVGPGRRPKPVLASTVARSALLKPLRVGLTRQVDKMLLEMGLGVRPTMPTTKVMDRFNELRLLMAQLLEAHKSAGVTSASISLGTVTPPKEAMTAPATDIAESRAGPAAAAENCSEDVNDGEAPAGSDEMTKLNTRRSR